MSSGSKSTGKKGFYGWYALAGAMLVTFINAGIFMYAFGLFLPEITAEFGWSRGQLATSVTLSMLFFGLPAPLWGILVTRFGARKTIIIGNIIAALGLAGMSLIQQPWHAYLFYSLTGLGAGLGGIVACSTLANNWFIRRRSLALASMTAAGGLGGFIFPPIITSLIIDIGWRSAWVAIGGIFIVGASLIGGVFMVRNRPEDMGQLPDGLPEASFTENAIADAAAPMGEETAGSPLKQALRQPTLWLIVIFTATFSFGMGTMTSHQVAYLTDAGFNPMTAAITVSLLAAMNIAGSLGFGALALRWNIRYLTVAFFALELIAMAILLTTLNVTLIYIYSLLLGISSGAVITSSTVFIGAYYHRTLYSRILGIVLVFQTASVAAAAGIAGAIYDITGAYTLAFMLVTILGGVGLICAFLARKPKTSPADTA